MPPGRRGADKPNTLLKSGTVDSGGTWHSDDPQYFPIGTDGKSAVSLDAPGQSGIKARVRSVYVNGSSGDTVNTTTYGPWKYLYFSN